MNLKTISRKKKIREFNKTKIEENFQTLLNQYKIKNVYKMQNLLRSNLIPIIKVKIIKKKEIED